MLLTSNWGPTKSFSLMPVDNNCPYVECLYNPMAKTLAIIGKTKKDAFHMVPRLDDNGEAMKVKVGERAGEAKKQRVQQESYTEYYITERKEIEAFIKRFAENEADFDYAKVLDMETMEDPSAIASGPQLIVD